MTKKYEEAKLYTFRIKYNAGVGHAAHDSYHYFQATNADQALSFHFSMMERKSLTSQTISVERKDPYANRWVEEKVY